MTKKFVIIIGGSYEQLPFIRISKKNGYKTIVIDRNQLCVGFQEADIKFKISTYNYKKIISRLIKLNLKSKIKYVINRSSGLPVFTATYLYKFINFPHTPTNSAKILTYKDKLYKFCKENFIKIPKTKIYKKTHPKISNNKIIKPAISLIGKQSVYLSNNNNLKNLQNAIKHSLNGKAIVQDFINGKNIVMYSHVIDKKLVTFEFLDEINLRDENNKFYGKGFSIPSLNVNYNIKNQAYKIANKIIKKLKINNSPFLISFIVLKNELYLIEIHLDIGGDMIIEHLLKKSSKINFVNLIFNMYTNDRYDKYKINFKPSIMLFEKENNPKIYKFETKMEMKKFLENKTN